MSLKYLLNAFTRKKQVQSSASAALLTQLSRCLSTFDLTLIGIGSTLGAGVYVLTGEISKNVAGPAIVMSFLIAGVASMLSGLCYAEFGARVPRAGSAYVYTYVTVGEFAAFVVGWNLLLEYSIGAASVARGLSGYLDSAVDHKIKNFTIGFTGKLELFGASEYLDFVAFFFCIIVAIFIAFGVENSSRLNNFCTISNIIVIVMVIAMGAFYSKPKNWEKFAPFGVSGIVSGASSCFFAFIGFDVIATTGEEARNPSRAIPISIVGTIVVCFLAYFGVSAVVTLMVPYYALEGDAALSKAFDQNNAQPEKYIISVGAILGLTGTNIVSMMPMPRLLYSMAQDGLVFKFLARVNEKTEVPVIATIITGILTAVMALLIDLADLVEMVSIGTLLAYSLVVISILILRYQPTTIGVVKENPADEDNNDTTVKEDSYVYKDVPAYEELSEHGIVGSTDSSSTDSLEGIGSDADSEPSVCVSQPTRATHTIVMICTLFGVLELFGICSILAFCVDDFSKKNLFVIIPFCIVVLGLIITVIIIARQPQNKQELHFKVPLLPWLPFLALFFNVYLILSLKKLTWLRFGIWMAVGFAIYFLYGIRHSVAPWKSGYQIRRSGYETIDSSDKNPPNRDDTSLKESYGTI